VGPTFQRAEGRSEREQVTGYRGPRVGAVTQCRRARSGRQVGPRRRRPFTRGLGLAGDIPRWARSETGGPFRLVFVLFFSFSIPFSPYLNLNLNLHLNSNFVTHHFATIFVKFKLISLRIFI
jgi:hypothetical protein